MTATGKRAAAISALERYFDDCDADAGDLLDALAAYLRAPEPATSPPGPPTMAHDTATALSPADLLLSAICTVIGVDVIGADRYGPAREACERFVESVRAPEAEPQPEPYCAHEGEGGGADAAAVPPLVLPVVQNDDPEITCLFCHRDHLPREYAIRYYTAPGGSALVGLHRDCYERARIATKATRTAEAEGSGTDTKTSGPEPTPRTEQVAEGGHRRKPVTETSADRGTESTAHTAPQRVPEDCGISFTTSDCVTSPFVSRACERGTHGCNVRHDAPSEEGEGPEVDTSDWQVPPEPESVLREKLAAAERRIAELERAAEETRYAEAKAHDETMERLSGAEKRIAELEADNRRLTTERAEAREALPEYLRNEEDLSIAIKVLAGHYAGEQTTADDFARELEQTRADLAEAWRWFECGREMVDGYVEALAVSERDFKAALSGGERLLRENADTKRDLEQARAALDESRTVMETILGLGVLNLVDHGITKPRAEALLERLSAMHDDPARLDADREEDLSHQAWLIECGNPALCYSQDGSSCRRWVTFTDPAAWKFATKDEAEAIIRERNLTGAIATEHGWWSPAPSAADEEKAKRWGVWSRTLRPSDSKWHRVVTAGAGSEIQMKRLACAWNNMSRDLYVYEARELPADAEAGKETI